MTTLTIFIKMEYRFILPVLSHFFFIYFFITNSFIYSIFPVLFFILELFKAHAEPFHIFQQGC